MANEPQLRRGNAPTNAFANRWRWWYSAISDYMLANPQATNADIAAHLQKHPNTISLITNTDLFRDYHAQRKQEFQQANDFLLQKKLGSVAEKGLDLLLEVMQKKGDQVPLTHLVNITTSALENLGYGPKAPPPVQVNNNVAAQMVVAPVSAGELSAARDALRLAEQRRLSEPLHEILPPQCKPASVDDLLDEDLPNVSRLDQ